MLRRLILIPIFALFLSVLVGAHFYLADRLALAPGWPPVARQLALCAIILGGVLLVLQPISERLLPLRIGRYVAWPAACWMGLGYLALNALFASEGLLLLLAVSAPPELVESGFVARARALAVLGLVLPAGLIALRQGLALPGVKRVEVALERWPAELDGLRVVQISDIHFGALRGRAFARYLVDEINRLGPDLIAITGDLVDGAIEHLGQEIEPLESLSAPLGTYFVTGNHDHYSGARRWHDKVASLGIRVLRNESTRLHVGGQSIELVGVDDHRSRQMPGEGGEDLDAALAAVDPGLPTILLAHDPSTFKAAKERGIDLQLSGHTHGGQIWPFEYLVRLAIPYVAGLYRYGRAALYVSRGTGFWGPPMRLRAPAEITELILRRAA